MKTNVSYKKTWHSGANENASLENFGEVTVTVKLQVKAGDANWVFAEEYDPLVMDGNPFGFTAAFFTSTMSKSTGKWSGSFTSLPKAIVSQDGSHTLLQYRVVETEITYTLPGETETTEITVTYNDDGTYTLSPSSTLITGVSGTGNNITNTLETMDLQVTKVWEDSDNHYNTRPEGDAADLETTFLVQYKDQNVGAWSAYLVNDPDNVGETIPLLVTVSGADGEDSASALVEDLPGITGRQYRAVELQPNYAEYDLSNINNYIVEDGETYYTGYEVEYDTNPVEGTDPEFATTATNTLQTTKVYGEKKWQPYNQTTYPSVRLQLQYLAADGTTWNDLGAPVTLESSTPQTWEHVWENLPLYLPGSLYDVKKGEATQYRVIELTGSGYEQVKVETGEKEVEGDRYPLYTLTNKLVRNFAVKKVWNSAPVQSENWQVTVGLYRTSGTFNSENPDFSEAYQVNDVDGNHLTCTLSEDNAWAHTFTGLDEYDERGNKYTYYAKELLVDTDPSSQGGEVTVSNNTFQVTVNDESVEFVVEYDHKADGTAVTNRVMGQLAVEKFWWDTGAEDQRQRLERSVRRSG